MLKRSTVSLLVLGFMMVSNIAQSKEHSKIYRIPEDVKCQSMAKELFSEDEEAPISKKVTYCTDTEGNPLNGQMIKYHQGIALKRYPMKDGYLHGVGKVYYKNGKLKTALNYKKGVLNGYVLEFDNKKTNNFNGNIIEKIPYVNGQKEGIATYYNENNVAKVAYENDKIQGNAKVWDKDKKIKIYDLGYADNKLVSATYYYDAQKECEENCRKEHCKTQCEAEKLYKCVQQKCQPLEGQTKEVKVPPLIVFGVNYQCFVFQEKLSADKRPMTYSISPECNKTWLVKNAKQISEHLGKLPQKGQNMSKIPAISETNQPEKTLGQAKDIKDTVTMVAVKKKQQSVNPEPIQKKANKEFEVKKKFEIAENKKEEAAPIQTDDCEDLGLPGIYTIKENYKTKDKDTVCVATKDNAENLLQYNKTKDLLRIWAPKKACSAAEKILNTASCEASSMLYKFRMGEREIKPQKYSYGIIAGIYSYINQENSQETRKIPPLIIEGINQKCLVLQSVISYSTCPVIATGSSKECNQMWRQQHREEIIGYIKGCRAETNKR